MKYTLDSKELIEQALQGEFKSAKIFSVPMIKSGLELLDLKFKKDVYYFGVLTISNDADAHFSYLGNKVIMADRASQIILPFTEVIFKDAGVEVDPVGLFYGFEIQVQY